MKHLLLLILSAAIGAISGTIICLSIISGFTEMILSPVFNLYYSSIFFVVGSYYTYKIIKKNQI